MLLNKDVFLVDPTTTTIPNLGVTQVGTPSTAGEWEVLRYELEHFVCEGEYERGLDRILSTYLSHLGHPQQPAAWVSGFFGSGKSHLVKVLEYLWRDYVFPDGATARGLTLLPQDIKAHFVELSRIGRQEGGLWSAAGMLGAGAGNSVRLALLGIVCRAAELPQQYPPACFVLWLKQNGLYDAVVAGVARRGRELERELPNMYVSPSLAESLLEADPGLAADVRSVHSLLRTQFPRVDDISDDELVATLRNVLAPRSTTPGKLPATLIVLDELQQYIGEDLQRTLQVQQVVEACSAQFGSRLLFVATGQAAMEANPQLAKLQGRFQVRVTLSDADVERVVRQVVLRKKPDRVADLQAVLDHVSGEIDRHLAGTRIAASAADRADLIADYPLLPVRRRLWERTLRAVDTAGKVGQLRTQLKIVHETTQAVAERPLGWVVPADVIFDQLKIDMLANGTLLREFATTIDQQADGSDDGLLKQRLCAMIFLIGRLPGDGPAATGLRATADALADLLVDDLPAGSAALRQRIPALLQSLAESGTLMAVADEYRLQTREGQQWETDFRARFSKIQADEGRIAGDRSDALRTAVAGALKGMTLTQGASKTPRRYDINFGVEPPPGGGNVPVWVRDEWQASEKTVRDDAQAAGVESPTVFVLLPRRQSDVLRQALAQFAAAKECVDAHPPQTTAEGSEARTAMVSRRETHRAQLDAIVKAIIEAARVFQGGGNEVAEVGLQDCVRRAIEDALVRLFPRFNAADSASWATAIKRVQEGGGDPLAAVGYHGDVDQHPACQDVRAFVGNTGRKGSEVRRQFTGAPYGWPQDAVDAALLVLTAGGFVRAARGGQPLTLKQLPQGQLGAIDFAQEGITITATQKVAMRTLLQNLGVTCKPGEEGEKLPDMLTTLHTLAAHAGGEPPLPAVPDVAHIDQLRAMGGNAQFTGVFDQRARLRQDYSAWLAAGQSADERLPRWRVVQRLLGHAAALPVAAAVRPQAEAITSLRSLLTEPNPATPLGAQLAGALREALQRARGALIAVRNTEVGTLEKSADWQRLPAADRSRILREKALEPPPALEVGTDETLLRTLDATPLGEWANRAALVPLRTQEARAEAAKLLEPKVVAVTPPHATLRTAAEAATYVDQLRAAIMAHIEAGNPVII